MRFIDAEIALQAREATAHNSGETVLEARDDGHATLLIMSSWPRAQEAAAALEANGLNVERVGDTGLRVVDPLLATLKGKDMLAEVREVLRACDRDPRLNTTDVAKEILAAVALNVYQGVDMLAEVPSGIDRFDAMVESAITKQVNISQDTVTGYCPMRECGIALTLHKSMVAEITGRRCAKHGTNLVLDKPEPLEFDPPKFDYT